MVLEKFQETIFSIRHLALILLIFFASMQFFLLLRHKSTYLSDSYFYKHIFYEIKGDSFEVARRKVVSQVDLLKADEVSKNFYIEENSYKNSLSFFLKRPLLPVMAVILSFIVKSEYLSFLIPIFISYIGSIIISYYFFIRGLNFPLAVITTALLVAFYPFLDWSTYFLTDTIGFLFWMIQLLLIYIYLSKRGQLYLYLFLFSLILSLALREQSVLMLPLLFFGYLFAFTHRNLKSYLPQLKKMARFSFLIVMIYFLQSILFSQKNLLDTIIYTMNNYGLYEKSYSLKEIILFQVSAVVRAHIGFLRDLISHHWWLFFTFLGVIGVVHTLLFQKKQSIISLLILSSAISSYLSIFLYPVLSYRYFFPVLIAIIYFSVKLFESYSNFINGTFEE